MGAEGFIHSSFLTQKLGMCSACCNPFHKILVKQFKKEESIYSLGKARF